MELGLPLGDPGVKPDPGNSDPEALTVDLTDDELLDVMKLVEDEIALLPSDDDETEA